MPTPSPIASTFESVEAAGVIAALVCGVIDEVELIGKDVGVFGGVVELDE